MRSRIRKASPSSSPKAHFSKISNIFVAQGWWRRRPRRRECGSDKHRARAFACSNRSMSPSKAAALSPVVEEVVAAQLSGASTSVPRALDAYIGQHLAEYERDAPPDSSLQTATPLKTLSAPPQRIGAASYDRPPFTSSGSSTNSSRWGGGGQSRRISSASPSHIPHTLVVNQDSNPLPSNW